MYIHFTVYSFTLYTLSADYPDWRHTRVQDKTVCLLPKVFQVSQFQVSQSQVARNSCRATRYGCFLFPDPDTSMSKHSQTEEVIHLKLWDASSDDRCLGHRCAMTILRSVLPCCFEPVVSHSWQVGYVCRPWWRGSGDGCPTSRHCRTSAPVPQATDGLWLLEHLRAGSPGRRQPWVALAQLGQGLRLYTALLAPFCAGKTVWSCQSSRASWHSEYSLLDWCHTEPGSCPVLLSSSPSENMHFWDCHCYWWWYLPGLPLVQSPSNTQTTIH